MTAPTHKLTPWFPPDTKPFRTGEYEGRWPALPAIPVRRVLWHNNAWRVADWTGSIFTDQRVEWRGLDGVSLEGDAR